MADVKGYDILGNIAVVKFSRGASLLKKKRFALQFMKERKQVTTVLEKVGKFHGRLRTNATKFISGVKTKEALYRENGCEFRFNTDSCYFSPRLSTERKEIANSVRKGEEVLVLFGGVAPFAIVVAKTGKPSRVVSVELGRECSKYARENVRRNKLDGKVEIIQGDVRKVLPKIRKNKGRFDRIVMARPNLKDSFLEVAFPLMKKGGIIHYYGFYPENEKNKLIELVEREAGKAKRKVRILRVKEAGNIGVRKFRFRADLKVIN